MLAHGTYSTPGSTHVAGPKDDSLEQRLQEIENGRRDVRAMVFLVGMVSAGALTVVTTLLMTGA